MSSSDPDKDRLAQQYDRLASKVSELYSSGKERGSEAMAAALEKAREQMTALGEFTAEQGEILTKYLDRDLQQTLSDAQELGEEAKVKLHPARLGAGALASLAAMLEFSGDALHTLSLKTRQALTYKTGELTSAGSLTCLACGQKIQLKHTGHVPPCPKCNGTLFRKGY